MFENQAFNYQQEIERLKDLFEFDFVALALVQSVESRFAHKWEYVSGNRSNRYRRITLQTGKGIAGHVFKTGKPLFIQDVATTLAPNDLFNYPIVVAEGLKSFGAIPLYKYNRVNGVLLVAYRDDKRMTTETFIEFENNVGPNFGPYYSKEMVKH
ncbi:MAG TPA: GAF domain-containing protein [Sporosarcina psychrophila]|uniref:GAF domain-containing protein n=1 Tax=Sporosarcina psychrophila TaxID=1476 RepID=A0A921FWM7_SPOPS|nr:GAF domain-containing protein [Sporosarcina psychrophila]